MSNEFRELLKKVGSGTHTHKDLTFDEASIALEMMLTEVATPAQIGAFLIAHRIKRPTAEELGGMLNSYNKLGHTLTALNSSAEVVVLGIPYDGRTRTAPISPITALVLSAMDIPVIMHGGVTMPTKYGLTLADIWASLGVDVTKLSLARVDRLLSSTNFAFLYLPNHFPLAHNMVTYRDQIGKRPPLATLELIWRPYRGKTHIMAGFVHPPTEQMIKGALKLNGQEKFTLIKGMEGSGDLKLSQTNIISIDRNEEFEKTEESKYLKINAREYGLEGEDPILDDRSNYFQQLQQNIQGKNTPLTQISIFNGGFYLWRCGVVSSMEEGLKVTKELLSSGKLARQLDLIRERITSSTD